MKKTPDYIDLAGDDPFTVLMELAATDPVTRATLQSVIAMWRFSSALTRMINALPALTEGKRDNSIDIVEILTIAGDLPDDIRATIEPQMLRASRLTTQHNASLRYWREVRANILARFGEVSAGPHYKTVMAVVTALTEKYGSEYFHQVADRIARELPLRGEVLFSAEAAPGLGNGPDWSDDVDPHGAPAMLSDLLTAMALADVEEDEAEPYQTIEPDDQRVWPSAHDVIDSGLARLSANHEPRDEQERQRIAYRFTDALANVLAELPHMMMHGNDGTPENAPWEATDVDVIMLLREYKILPTSMKEAIEVEWLSVGVMLNDVNAVQSEAIGVYGRVTGKLGIGLDSDSSRDNNAELRITDEFEVRAVGKRRLPIIGASLAGGLAVAIAALVLGLLVPTSSAPKIPNRVRTPVFTATTNPSSALPINEHDFAICTPVPGIQSPAATKTATVTTPEPATKPKRRKSAKVQFVSDIDTLILKGEDESTYRLTLTKLSSDEPTSETEQESSASSSELRTRTVDMRDLIDFDVTVGVSDNMSVVLEAKP